MLRAIACTALVGVFLAASASACSVGLGYEPFYPNPKPFEFRILPGPPAQAEEIPAPVVTIEIKRGDVGTGSSCDGLSWLRLKVQLPSASTYRLEDFGIYLRIVGDRTSRLYFPSDAISGPIRDGAVSMSFHWYEGPDTRPMPLNQKVEAFFVNNRFFLGPSTIFDIKG